MESYQVDGSISISAIIPDIRYNVMEFKSFNVREVNVDGKDIGEYHIGFKGIRDSSVIDLVKECTGSSDAEVLDPEDYLKLEFGTYFKLDPNSMEAINIDGILTDLDTKIAERFSKNGI